NVLTVISTAFLGLILIYISSLCLLHFIGLLRHFRHCPSIHHHTPPERGDHAPFRQFDDLTVVEDHCPASSPSAHCTHIRPPAVSATIAAAYCPHLSHRLRPSRATHSAYPAISTRLSCLCWYFSLATFSRIIIMPT